MRRALWILAAAAVAAVLVIGVIQAGGGTSEKPPGGGAASLTAAQRALRGSPAPLAALHADADQIKPSSYANYQQQLKGLRGYPVVVNAWASWCGPCKLEFPLLRHAATSLGRSVAFLGLNTTDNTGNAKAFLKGQPVPYPHLEDGSGRILQRAAAAGGLPTTIFYDRQGRRQYIHQGGYRSEAQLVRDIKRYAGA